MDKYVKDCYNNLVEISTMCYKNEYIFMEELCKQTINPLQIPNWLKQLR